MCQYETGPLPRVWSCPTQLLLLLTHSGQTRRFSSSFITGNKARGPYLLSSPHPIKKKLCYSLVSVRAEPRGFVVLAAVDVGAVGEGAVPPPHGTTSTLVLEVPVEAREGTMLLALVLQEQRTLLHTKFLKVSGRERKHKSMYEVCASTRQQYEPR